MDRWPCPLCGVVKMKFGTTCKTFPECGNKLHITGSKYYHPDGTPKDLLSEKGTGISEISNEENK